MSIFGDILHKIGEHWQKTPAGAKPTPAPPVSAPPAASAVPSARPAKVASASTPAEPIDVEHVLTEMAAKKGGGGNWRTSIVDLLKMLDLDSSLAARKELGQ